MAEEVLLTKEGKEELEKRLEYLKVTKRAEITERIKIARDFGDLSENAEYDAAKNEQAMIEGEILEIEEKLKFAVIIGDSAAPRAFLTAFFVFLTNALIKFFTFLKKFFIFA